MVQPVAIDDHEITITPVFKIMEIENIPKSETAGHAVMEIHEMVEIRFAGTKSYIPVVPVNSFWRSEGNNVITYAERWPDQYRQFKQGNPQEAAGTALENLRPLGVTPEQLSLCRALRIYSIEALHSLDAMQLKSLGMNGNSLKAAAAAYLAERGNSVAQLGELDALRARIAELEGRSTIVPVIEPTLDEVEAVIKTAEDAFSELTDAQIKANIEELTGNTIAGKPSRKAMVQMLDELTKAA